MTVVGSSGVFWRDWFVYRLSGALEALGATESSRGPVGIVLVSRIAVGAAEIRGVAIVIGRWRRCWLSLAVIRLSSASTDWQEATSSAYVFRDRSVGITPRWS